MDSGDNRERGPQRQSRKECRYRSLQQEGAGLISKESLRDFSPVKPRTVGNKYAVEGMVGSGALCRVYQGSDLKSHEVVGIKLEDTRTDHALHLLHESRLYNILRGGKGVPNMRWFGQEQGYNVMVLDRLGPNLLHLFNICGQRFSLKTVIMLGYQMIDRVEYVHSRGLVHRDLKPENFLLGCGRQGNQVFIIDFGLAKEYVDPETRRHIPFRERRSFTGTARYASRNQHCGIEHSRRDDIESLSYVLMYFLRGNLPWQGHSGQHSYMHNNVKMDTSVEQLCEGFPASLQSFCTTLGGWGFTRNLITRTCGACSGTCSSCRSFSSTMFMTGRCSRNHCIMRSPSSEAQTRP